MLARELVPEPDNWTSAHGPLVHGSILLLCSSDSGPHQHARAMFIGTIIT